MHKKAGSCNAHRCSQVYSLKPFLVLFLTGSKRGLWQHLLWGFSLHSTHTHIDDLLLCHIKKCPWLSGDACLHIDYTDDSNYKRLQIVFFFLLSKIFHFSLLSPWKLSVILCQNVCHCHWTPRSCPHVHPSSAGYCSMRLSLISVLVMTGHLSGEGCRFLLACLTLLGKESTCKVMRVTLH